MKPSDIDIAISRVMTDDISRLFSSYVFRIWTSREACITERDRQTGKADNPKWLCEKVLLTCTIPQLCEIIKSCIRYQFEDDDYAYIIFVITELRSKAFLEIKRNSLINHQISEVQLELISMMDRLREDIHDRACKGYEKYHAYKDSTKSSNTVYINPFRTQQVAKERTLVYKPFAEEAVESLDDNFDILDGGWSR